LHDLQDAGVPYPDIRMAAHVASELEGIAIDQTRLASPAPEQFWSLSVVPDAKWDDKAAEVLRKHAPLALGRVPTSDNRRDDTERGAIAWRHYVFETNAATDAVGEYAGTTGNTGIISSGVFAEGTHAEGNPPSPAIDADDARQAHADKSPTSDTMQPQVSNERSRPDTKLTEQ
jgi:hypothetical protein